MERNANRSRIAAVDRALALLALLSERESVAVTDAAQTLGVAPSTAHRLLATLVSRGFAVQVRQRRYSAGPALLAPGWARPAPSLTETVRPYVERLFAATEETCHVMVLEGALVHFIDGIEGAQTLRVGLRTGAQMPAHRTSGGKAMLAEFSSGDLKALCSEADTVDLTELTRQLAGVRRSRTGLNRDETEPGVTALGASIGRVAGHHAALSVAVPTARLTAERARDLSRHLRAVCEDARRDLGDA